MNGGTFSRLLRALVRRETGGAWWAALPAAALFGAYVAWRIAGAGLFDGDAAAARATSPVLARMVALPGALGLAAMAGVALLAIVRTGEDRLHGWLVPLATVDAVRPLYPAALACAVVVPLIGAWTAASTGFIVTRAMLTGAAAAPAVEAMRFAAVMAACLAAAVYGIALAGLMRTPALAIAVAAVLYVLAALPMIIAALAGAEPTMLQRALTLALPAPNVAPGGATLLRHTAYALAGLALLVAVGPRLFGRVR